MRYWLILLLASVALASQINGYATTGQSLSYGYGGCAALSTTQPYSNVMLSTNPVGAGTPTPSGAFTALVESWSVTCGVTESMASALANGIDFNNGNTATWISAVNNEGIGSTSAAQIAKGGSTASYSNMQAAVAQMSANAVGAGNTFVAQSILDVNGETDFIDQTTGASYEATTYVTLFSNAKTDMGFKHLLISQMSSWSAVAPAGGPCWTGDTSATCATTTSGAEGVPMGQLQTYLDHPTDTCFVGPKYQYTYVDTEHINNTAYRAHGELAAWFAYQMDVLGIPCVPLVPRSTTLSGATLTVRFYVPASGSLAIDTSAVAQRTDYGFYFHDNAASAPSVSILETCGGGSSPCITASGDTVTITLTGTPSGGTPMIAYAWKTPVNGSATTGASHAGAPGGNVRSTNTVPSLSGQTDQEFWAPTFNISANNFSFAIPQGSASRGNSAMSGNFAKVN